jgi:hypothetical protein
MIKYAYQKTFPPGYFVLRRNAFSLSIDVLSCLDIPFKVDATTIEYEFRRKQTNILLKITINFRNKTRSKRIGIPRTIELLPDPLAGATEEQIAQATVLTSNLSKKIFPFL